ncbi:hypothetical protein CHH73_16215 [Shouchella clausii]|nr:HAD-IIA family hydrolase [Shouchella clausii]PAD15075.1 hypothetical protein CHH73_16215 [Shouchella clausii]
MLVLSYVYQCLLGFFVVEKRRMGMDKYSHYFFDLDGTLLHGGMLLPGAKELVDALCANGKHVYFLTNHPVRSRKVLSADLQKLGLEITYNQLLTPVMGLIEYVHSNGLASRKLYVAGSNMIREELFELGLHIGDCERGNGPEQIAVVLGMSPDLTYRQLQEALWLIQNGASLILLNEDLLCPHPKGFLIDTGSLARLLDHPRFGHQTVSVGKPSYWMQKALLRVMEGKIDDAVIIGDSLLSDIGIGNALGIDTILVYSGITTKDQLFGTAHHPTSVYASVQEIYQTIKG